jgi:hypothetical protein
MIRTKAFKLAWVLSLLAAALLACSSVTNLGNQVSGARGTAQSVATQVDQARDLMATGEGVATRVAESGLVQTAQAVSTQVAQTGLDETAQAVATQLETRGIEGTARAMLTQELPGLAETIQAVATNQGPGLVQTAQALATQLASSLGQAPADIPVVEGEKQDYNASDFFVTYSTSLNIAEVLTFYKTEMPNQGWTKIEEGSVETDQSAILNYDKPDRKASVVLSAGAPGGGTIVAITIQPK